MSILQDVVDNEGLVPLEKSVVFDYIMLYYFKNSIYSDSVKTLLPAVLLLPRKMIVHSYACHSIQGYDLSLYLSIKSKHLERLCSAQ